MGRVGQNSGGRREALREALDAEHNAQRRGCRSWPEYFQPPGGQAVHVQHRADCKCTAIPSAHRRPEGKSCIRTTTYHAFALFKPHRSKTAVRIETQDSSPLGISVSASRAEKELV